MKRREGQSRHKYSETKKSKMQASLIELERTSVDGGLGGGFEQNTSFGGYYSLASSTWQGQSGHGASHRVYLRRERRCSPIVCIKETRCNGARQVEIKSY